MRLKKRRGCLSMKGCKAHLDLTLAIFLFCVETGSLQGL